MAPSNPQLLPTRSALRSKQRERKRVRQVVTLMDSGELDPNATVWDKLRHRLRRSGEHVDSMTRIALDLQRVNEKRNKAEERRQRMQLFEKKPKLPKIQASSYKTSKKYGPMKLSIAKLAILHKAFADYEAECNWLQKDLDADSDYQQRWQTSLAAAIEHSAHPRVHKPEIVDAQREIEPVSSKLWIPRKHVRRQIRRQYDHNPKLRETLMKAVSPDSSAQADFKGTEYLFKWRTQPSEKFLENYNTLEYLYRMVAQTSEDTSLHVLGAIPTDDHPNFSWKEVTGSARTYDVVERHGSYVWNASEGWLQEAMTGSSVGHLKRENFYSRSPDAYNVIAPAISLAWKLLNTERSLQWFDHLLTGDIRPHPMHAARHYIAESSRAGDAQWKRSRVRQIFKILESFMRLTTFEEVKHGKEAWGWCAMLRGSSDPKFLRNSANHQLGTREGDSIEISLQAKMIRYVACHTPGSMEWKTWTFYVAVVLCHESAHAANYARGTIDMNHHRYLHDHSEPQYKLGEPFNELGFSWEAAVLGSRVTPVQTFGNSMEPRGEFSLGQFVLMAITLPPEYYALYTDASKPAENEQTIITASWIQKWFEEDTWKYIAAEGIEFMQRESSKYGLVVKKDYPCPGWTVRYIKAPSHVLAVPAIVTRNGIDAPISLQLTWSCENAQWQSVAPAPVSNTSS